MLPVDSQLVLILGEQDTATWRNHPANLHRVWVLHQMDLGDLVSFKSQVSGTFVITSF